MNKFANLLGFAISRIYANGYIWLADYSWFLDLVLRFRSLLFKKDIS